uniref:methylenetetrahydrofolate reductase C-terminal domain-containing protein n=1 Tax=uncultured Jatrophihabitans sp. TaxID=1610747 RepID=UPI0035CA3D2B
MTRSAAPPTVDASCPKHMVFGPCGGVREDGSCEMRPGPCSFDALVLWPDEPPARPSVTAPRVLVDFTAPPYDLPVARDIARILAPHAGAVLVGEHQNRPDYPP